MENDTSRGRPKVDEKMRRKATLPMNGSYTMVFCHLETLASSFSPSLHLTQLAATTAEGDIFRPILPPNLTKYLDTYKLGGDLLLNLNMTREDDGDTFLFRRRFEVVTGQTERRECVSEEKALGDLLTFLETAGVNLILVCVDEDTVSVLMGKLKALDRRRVKRLVSGFTWWKRSLKNLSEKAYRDIELETFHRTTFPAFPLPSLYTALVVASMLKACVLELDRQQPGSSLCLAAVPAMYRAKARQREVNEVEEGEVVEEKEVLEIYTSFWPETTTCITADKLEQVAVDSDSEYEDLSEDENVNMKQEQDHVIGQNQEVLVISSDSEYEESPAQSGVKKRRMSSPVCQPSAQQGLPTPTHKVSLELLQLPTVFPCLPKPSVLQISQAPTGRLGSPLSSMDSLGYEAPSNVLRTPTFYQQFWKFQLQHRDGLKVVCPICMENVSVKIMNLGKHMRKVHQNTVLENIGCKGCGAPNVNVSQLAKHTGCIPKIKKLGIEEFRERLSKKSLMTQSWEKSANGKIFCPYQACKSCLISHSFLEVHLAQQHPNHPSRLSLICPENHCMEQLTASQVEVHLTDHRRQAEIEKNRQDFWILSPGSVYFLECPECPKILSLADVCVHMEEVHMIQKERFCCKCSQKVAVVDVRNHFREHMAGGKIQEPGFRREGIVEKMTFSFPTHRRNAEIITNPVQVPQVNDPPEKNGAQQEPISKASSENPDIEKRSLKEHLVHLLAVRPQGEMELQKCVYLEKWKGRDKKVIRLSKLLNKVAVCKNNVYELKPATWNEVSADWPFYTTEDHAALKRRKVHNLHTPGSNTGCISLGPSISSTSSTINLQATQSHAQLSPCPFILAKKRLLE